MSDGSASRFDQDIVHLLRDKDSKLMNTSTKLAIDLQKQFCAAKGRAFKKQSLTDVVHSLLRIGSAHNKAGSPDIKIV